MAQVFIATVVESRARRLRLVADTVEAAAAQLRRSHGAGLRLQDITPEGGKTEDEGLDALRKLLASKFLTLGGKDNATLGHWIMQAASPEGRTDPSYNADLAMAGLRLRGENLVPDQLVIGSAKSVPFLAGRFAGSSWEAEALLATLIHLPGALRCGPLTFAGIPSRAVALPWALVSNLLEGGQE